MDLGNGMCAPLLSCRRSPHPGSTALVAMTGIHGAGFLYLTHGHRSVSGFGVDVDAVVGVGREAGHGTGPDFEHREAAIETESEELMYLKIQHCEAAIEAESEDLQFPFLEYGHESAVSRRALVFLVLISKQGVCDHAGSSEILKLAHLLQFTSRNKIITQWDPTAEAESEELQFPSLEYEQVNAVSRRALVFLVLISKQGVCDNSGISEILKLAPLLKFTSSQNNHFLATSSRQFTTHLELIRHMLKRRRNQLPEDAFDQLSLVFEQNQGLPMLDLNAASALGKWLYKAGCLYFYQTFLHSLVRVDLTQVGRANSHRASLGKPLQQNVPGTCAIMASVICVEAQHRLQYESIHGSGTFICEAAQPTDAIGACYSQIVWRADINAYGRIWMPDRGADVGDALNKVMAIGGFATTTLTSGRNPGAPSRLQLVSWERNEWNEPGKELTPDRVAQLLDTRGPFIGTLWVNPWYGLFDSEEDDDLVYRSGCARDRILQRRCEMVLFRTMSTDGFHSAVVFEYRRGGKQVHVLDNHTPKGPTRWVSYDELEYIHIVSVATIDPPFHHLPSGT